MKQRRDLQQEFVLRRFKALNAAIEAYAEANADLVIEADQGVSLADYEQARKTKDQARSVVDGELAKLRARLLR